MSDTKPTFGAVVLAGGLARRMGGVDKGLVEIGNRPMVAWVLDALTPVADSVVINANRSTDQYQVFGHPVIGDVVDDFPGPLAGLLSACETLETDWVLMCPCDSPFVTKDLVEHLRGSSEHSSESIVVAHDGARLQPVFAAIQRHLAPELRAYLEAGDRKIDRWFEQVGYEPIDCTAFASMFDNINTSEQQAAANERLMV